MIPDGFNIWKMFDGEIPVDICFRRMIGTERKHVLGYLSNQPGSDKLFVTSLASKIMCDLGEAIRLLERVAERDKEQFEEIADEITGVNYEAQERADEARLKNGGYLRMAYPHLLKNPCGECQKYVYFPRRGEFQIDAYGNRLPFESGVDKLACQTRSGCPRGYPSMTDQELWNEQMETVFQFDMLCRMANHWPDDCTVIRNKALLDEARKRIK